MATTRLAHSVVAPLDMPLVGFGTYRLKDDTLRGALRTALQLGYRMVDTAEGYGNEHTICECLPKEGLPFIVTKLANTSVSNKAEVVQARLDAHLSRLGVKTIDLWLMHWPGPGRDKDNKVDPPDWTPKMRIDCFRLMTGLLGPKLRAVGVSNFSLEQLIELEKHGLVPAVNQIEMHPMLVQRELRDYCRAKGIAVMAYNSLGKEGGGEVLRQPVVATLAMRHNVTPAQILLRWAHQSGAIIIPASTQAAHIAENKALVDSNALTLSPDEMKELDGLDQGKRNNWDGRDPNTVDVPHREWGDSW